MTLWECMVAVAVMVVCLPMAWMAESNAIQATRVTQSMSNEMFALTSAADDWFAGQSPQALMTEEGRHYVITESSTANLGTNSNVCHLVWIKVQQRQTVQSIQLEIPSCQSSLFTD